MKAKFCKGCIHEKDCDEEEVYVFENDEGKWECEHYKHKDLVEVLKPISEELYLQRLELQKISEELHIFVELVRHLP